MIKDGIQALEGVIETDWATSTFTMNWKLTRQCEWVSFKKGEPFCMLVPVPRGLSEQLAPKAVLMETVSRNAGEISSNGKRVADVVS